jgi:conjugative transposon TraM protein
MAEALNHINHPPKNTVSGSPPPVEKDPMQVFRQQMAYMDSIRKAEDPVYLARQKELAKAKAAAAKPEEKPLTVTKADVALADFNTIRPDKDQTFIMAIIDENVTGYADSRIRLRLLEDIVAGGTLVRKGTYLYALISGFSGQRVSLSVKSILYENKRLPVKLDIYDTDGLAGLYVPQSAFRDFTKDMGNNTIQGVSIEDNGTGFAASQFLMSTADKMFESTSSAIAGAIRKDKAKIKYNSYVYLIDSQKNN